MRHWKKDRNLALSELDVIGSSATAQMLLLSKTKQKWLRPSAGVTSTANSISYPFLGQGTLVTLCKEKKDKSTWIFVCVVRNYCKEGSVVRFTMFMIQIIMETFTVASFG